MICPKKVGGRVCEYMHAGAIYDALTQGRTVQKGGSNTPNAPASHTLALSGQRILSECRQERNEKLALTTDT